MRLWEFPGGSVVRILHLHCEGAQVLTLVRELRSHMSGSTIKKKKKERKEKKNQVVSLMLSFKMFVCIFWITVLYLPACGLSSLSLESGGVFCV